MTTFWIFIAVFVLVSLVLIWFPHFRQREMLKSEVTGVRQQTNLESFNDQLTLLEKDLSNNRLAQEEFDALKKELEVNLLQDMKLGEDESLTKTIKKKSILWPSVMSVIVIAISGYFYQSLGAYQELANPHAHAQNRHSGMTLEQQMQMRIATMEAQVKAEPTNSQLLFNLGQAYITASQYDNAVNTFDKLIEMLGEHAEFIGPKATALYYKANQHMTPQIQALVDKSLKLDPQDPSTLLLVGMDGFFTANYQKAIDSWQLLLDSNNPNIDRAAVMNAINSAQNKLNADQAMPNDEAHKNVNAAVTDKTVRVSVSIDPKLADQVNSSDMLFVFARATDGSKMPLAAAKISATALPTTITLDDSTPMGGNAKLSDAKKVEIIAVLSKHGSVMAKAGDLKGTLASVNVGDSALLVLNTQVK